MQDTRISDHEPTFVLAFLARYHMDLVSSEDRDLESILMLRQFVDRKARELLVSVIESYQSTKGIKNWPNSVIWLLRT